MANSANAINQLNQTVGSFKSKVDVKVNAVDSSTVQIKQATDRVYDSISAFKTNMEQNEEKQLAHENILRIDQILKEQFGDHEAVRKTVMGVVRDFDINLVRNSTIQELSEELWITSSRYWLSYALMAITAWINNYKEVAQNALSECVRRDPVKATLFFCLFNLRFGRNEVARKWFYEYFKTIDPAKMQLETAVLLQAYLNGLFGTDKELEYEVNNIIKGWMLELKNSEGISEQLTEEYRKHVINTQPTAQCRYQAIKESCENTKQVFDSYANVSKYDRLIAEVDALDVELEEQTAANYKSRLDEILIRLISDYDKEELELKNQQTYFNYVIEYNGRIDEAEKKFADYKQIQGDTFNIGKQMIKWAVYDDSNQTDVHVRKFGLQNTKQWFMQAIEDWNQHLMDSRPMDFKLSIDGWSSVSNGMDHQVQAASLNEYYESNKFRNKYMNQGNLIALILIVLSAGLAFVTIYSLVVTAVALGFLVFNIIKANKEYPKRVNASLQLLNGSMQELGDYIRFFEGNRVKKDTLLSKIEYL